MKGKPFIPAWLDDAGLSQAEFRLYSHLCRRAGNITGIAWPQAESITKTCGMARNTLWKTLRTLEEKQFIRRVGKPFAGSNRYQILTPPTGTNEIPIDDPIGANEMPIDQPPIGANESHQSAQMDSHQSAQMDSHQSAQMDSREGSPIKVLQVRESTREISLDGIQFATWFKSSLPSTVNLKSNWQQSFAKVHEDMVRLDKRTPEEIRAVTRWARTDPFWSKNFLSPLKLRSRDSSGTQYFDIFAERMKQPTPHPQKQTSAINLGRRASSTIRPTHEQFTFQKNGQQFRPFD